MSAFERDRYVDGQYQSLVGLIASRESYLHLFAAAAPSPAGDLWRGKAGFGGGHHRSTDGANCAGAPTGRDSASTPPIRFSAITLQIDLYGDVESAVRTGTPAGLTLPDMNAGQTLGDSAKLGTAETVGATRRA